MYEQEDKNKLRRILHMSMAAVLCIALMLAGWSWHWSGVAKELQTVIKSNLDYTAKKTAELYRGSVFFYKTIEVEGFPFSYRAVIVTPTLSVDDSIEYKLAVEKLTITPMDSEWREFKIEVPDEAIVAATMDGNTTNYTTRTTPIPDVRVHRGVPAMLNGGKESSVIPLIATHYAVKFPQELVLVVKQGGKTRHIKFDIPSGGDFKVWLNMRWDIANPTLLFCHMLEEALARQGN